MTMMSFGLETVAAVTLTSLHAACGQQINVDNLTTALSPGCVELGPGYTGLNTSSGTLLASLEHNCTQPTPSVNGSATLLLERRIGHFLIVYGNLFIVVLGIIGNPLSFVVSRQRAHTSSPHFYMTVMALWDFSFLVFKTIYNYREEMRITMGDSACKLFHFLFPYTSHCAVWTLVAMTAERYVAIWFPWKMTSSLAVKRAKITAASIAVIALCLNLHVFWTWGAVYRKNQVKCRINKSVRMYFEWIDDIFYSFAPFIVIVILNILIIIGLREKEMKRASMRSQAAQSGSSGSTSRDASQSKTQKQITLMLLTVAISFAVLTGPKCISNLVFKYATPQNVSAHEHAVNFLVFIVFDLLVVLQHCINFYLYFLTGKIFRKELAQLLHCERCTCPCRCEKERRDHVSLSIETAMLNSRPNHH